MREITSHVVNPANDQIQILVTDLPGAGGAPHRYEVTGYDASTNSSRRDGDTNQTETVVLFQNGPIPEFGVNGVTHEVLLAILIDRMEAFQAGPYACEENASALEHLQEAKAALESRTRERMERNVEGTHEL